MIMIYRRLFGFPGYGTRNPFEELASMRQQFDRLVNTWSGDIKKSIDAGVFPQVNLTEDTNQFYLRAELPGLKNDAIDIQATGKTIAISGERKIPEEDAKAHYHRREREAGKFSRILTMPTEIDADRIEAKLENGILTIKIPKAETVKPRQIAIH
jgi:HSP20 family protein